MTWQDKAAPALVWCDLIYLNHTDRMSLYLYDINVFQRGLEIKFIYYSNHLNIYIFIQFQN